MIATFAALCLAGCERFERPGQPVAEKFDDVGPTRIQLFTQNGSPAGFEVVGLKADRLLAIKAIDPARRQSILRAYVDSQLVDAPAISGSVDLVDKSLRFFPRYPLEAGISYRLLFDPGEIGASHRDKFSATITIPAKVTTSSTSLTNVYPTAAQLPENQLKFYLHFSGPMSRGEAYRHIHLLDESGRELEAVFLELDQELWNSDQTRFTLLCDPGRVKRGLKPREELGPVLEGGKRYTLVIDPQWRDAGRAPLKESFRKSFVVVAPDEQPIDPATWKLELPRAGSPEPLVVHLGESLDHSLLERVLSVVDAAGKKLAGSIEIGDSESTWRFQPSEPWQAGSYQLVAASTIEDLAGNSIGRAFEVDASKASVPHERPTDAVLPFVIE